MITRRTMLSGLAIGYLGRFSVRAGATTKAEEQWFDVSQWGVEGKGFEATAAYYDRLPAEAQQEVRGPVWSLSRHSAGMIARFRAETNELSVRYTLTSDQIAMPHMPATGVSGVDLYALDDKGRERWVQVSRPTSQSVTGVLARGIDPPAGGGMREYSLYLPLYNGVKKLEIGVGPQGKLEPVAPRTDKPIVFYGTSIMHGACASRPGMAIPAILGRRLGVPTINLGFSGNGRMELEVGKYLCQLDAAVQVIDCLPNLQGEQVAQRTIPLVKQLRASQPTVPILLVEDRTYSNAGFFASSRARHEKSRLALRTSYEKLQAEGTENLYYLEGKELIGSDGEGATDGSHPNDLGMMRYADHYERILRKILTRG
jgi:hypothetical protein